MALCVLLFMLLIARIVVMCTKAKKLTIKTAVVDDYHIFLCLQSLNIIFIENSFDRHEEFINNHESLSHMLNFSQQIRAA